MIEQDTYRVVKRVIPEGKTMCGLCSRLRRAPCIASPQRTASPRLPSAIIATISSRLCSQHVLRRSPEGDGAEAPERGRPSCSDPAARLRAERDIARYARGRAFPIIPCQLCGSQPNMQRVAVKNMLAAWSANIRDAAPQYSPRCRILRPNIWPTRATSTSRSCGGRHRHERRAGTRTCPASRIRHRRGGVKSP